MRPRSETMAIVRQHIINAGSNGVPCRELAATMGMTWNTLKTMIYKLGKSGFEVAYRCRGGVPLYFVRGLAPPSTADGSIRPKSTRVTCEQFILLKLAAAGADGLTFAEVRGRWQKNTVALAVQNLRSAGKVAVGKWSTGDAKTASGRIFLTVEQRDAAMKREMDRRAAEKAARMAEGTKRREAHHAKRRREAEERAAARAAALAIQKRRDRLVKLDRSGRPIPARAEIKALPNTGPVAFLPGVVPQVIPAKQDTRFKADPSEASMYFSAMGPGRYMRNDNAIARAYGSGK